MLFAIHSLLIRAVVKNPDDIEHNVPEPSTVRERFIAVPLRAR